MATKAIEITRAAGNMFVTSHKLHCNHRSNHRSGKIGGWMVVFSIRLSLMSIFGFTNFAIDVVVFCLKARRGETVSTAAYTVAATTEFIQHLYVRRIATSSRMLREESIDRTLFTIRHHQILHDLALIGTQQRRIDGERLQFRLAVQH